MAAKFCALLASMLALDGGARLCTNILDHRFFAEFPWANYQQGGMRSPLLACC